MENKIVVDVPALLWASWVGETFCTQNSNTDFQGHWHKTNVNQQNELWRKKKQQQPSRGMDVIVIIIIVFVEFEARPTAAISARLAMDLANSLSTSNFKHNPQNQKEKKEKTESVSHWVNSKCSATTGATCRRQCRSLSQQRTHTCSPITSDTEFSLLRK